MRSCMADGFVDPLLSSSAIMQLETKIDILSQFVVQQLSVLMSPADEGLDEAKNSPCFYIGCDDYGVWEALEAELNPQQIDPVQLNANATFFIPSELHASNCI